eukprot:316003-Prymnesium_polylepis.2
MTDVLARPATPTDRYSCAPALRVHTVVLQSPIGIALLARQRSRLALALARERLVALQPSGSCDAHHQHHDAHHDTPASLVLTADPRQPALCTPSLLPPSVTTCASSVPFFLYMRAPSPPPAMQLLGSTMACSTTAGSTMQGVVPVPDASGV